MKIQQMKTATLIAGLAACCGVGHAAVITPYTADFGTGVGQVDVTGTSEFVVTEGASLLTTQADSLNVTYALNDTYYNMYTAVETDLSAGDQSDFSMTSTVTMGVNGGSGFTRFGFSFLGDAGTGTGLTALFYPNTGADGTFGQLRIRELDFGNAGNIAVDRTGGSIADGTEYTLSLAGTFNVAGDLALTFSVVDATGGNTAADMISATITAADLAGDLALTDNYFGVAGRIRDGFSADFDSLTVIPEPGTLSLLSATAIAALMIRRARRR